MIGFYSENNPIKNNQTDAYSNTIYFIDMNLYILVNHYKYSCTLLIFSATVTENNHAMSP